MVYNPNVTRLWDKHLTICGFSLLLWLHNRWCQQLWNAGSSWGSWPCRINFRATSNVLQIQRQHSLKSAPHYSILECFLNVLVSAKPALLEWYFQCNYMVKGLCEQNPHKLFLHNRPCRASNLQPCQLCWCNSSHDLTENLITDISHVRSSTKGTDWFLTRSFHWFSLYHSLTIIPAQLRETANYPAQIKKDKAELLKLNCCWNPHIMLTVLPDCIKQMLSP